MQSNLKTIKKQGEEIRDEFKEKLIGYIAAAFGLVAGLAWNEAIKALIDYFFPVGQPGQALWAKFFYAILMTVVVVVIAACLMKLVKKKDN